MSFIQPEALQKEPIMRELHMRVAALRRQLLVGLVVVAPPAAGPDQIDPIRVELVDPGQHLPEGCVAEVVGV